LNWLHLENRRAGVTFFAFILIELGLCCFLNTQYAGIQDDLSSNCAQTLTR